MGSKYTSTFNNLSSQVKQYASTVYPGMAGKKALRFIDDNFRKQSWEGIPWKRRKGGPRNAGRALLVDRGILRRGNRFSSAPGQPRVYIVVPYGCELLSVFSVD
ncbi:hypothetical protein [Flavihumibacter fluvii]|uniref:hypothetical protein n=1 Tax=Flavihumibacter fluvii TaxID=2838157 RepID=UPI001BDF595A|nr:hypothetical protein [Flavihumibacter fluvii]ULQ52178.1 hypothetical protein KJS93_18975 [Flavihumibacter fluvii]